jgi:hypothetical protein
MIRTVEIVIPETAGTVGQVDALAMCQSAAAQAQEFANNSAQWLTGAGAPSNSIGVENQLYLDTDTGDMWKKGTLVWVFLMHLFTDLVAAQAFADASEAASLQSAVHANDSAEFADAAAGSAASAADVLENAIDTVVAQASAATASSASAAASSASAAAGSATAASSSASAASSSASTASSSASTAVAAKDEAVAAVANVPAVGSDVGAVSPNYALGELAFYDADPAAALHIASTSNPHSVTATQAGAIPATYLDTDTALAANSDSKVPSQKAVKAYIDGQQYGMTPIQTMFWSF